MCLSWRHKVSASQLPEALKSPVEWAGNDANSQRRMCFVAILDGLQVHTHIQPSILCIGWRSSVYSDGISISQRILTTFQSFLATFMRLVQMHRHQLVLRIAELEPIPLKRWANMLKSTELCPCRVMVQLKWWLDPIESQWHSTNLLVTRTSESQKCVLHLKNWMWSSERNYFICLYINLFM